MKIPGRGGSFLASFGGWCDLDDAGELFPWVFLIRCGWFFIMREARAKKQALAIERIG